MSSDSPPLPMGRELGVYRNSGVQNVVVGGAVCGGAVLVGLCMLVLRIGPGIESSSSWAMMLCTGGILGAAAVGLTLPRALRARHTRVTLYEQGLVYRAGKDQVAMHWNEIAAVWLLYAGGGTRRQLYPRLVGMTLQGRDGAKLAIDFAAVSKASELAEHIQRQSATHLLPAYIAAYDQGKPLRFGPLQVSRAGLALKDKVLTWDQVGSVQRNDWYISFKDSAGRDWAALALSQAAIPNPQVLLALLERIGAGKFKVEAMKRDWSDVWLSAKLVGALVVLCAAVVGALLLRNALVGTLRANQVRPFAAQLSQYSDMPDLRSGDGPPYVVGKLIVIDQTTQRVDDVYFRLPSDLRASRPDEVGTIVWLDCSETIVGRYRSGSEGYQTSCVVTVIDQAKATIVAQETLAGPEPPLSKSSPGDWHGGRPTNAIIKYLTTLPRQ